MTIAAEKDTKRPLGWAGRWTARWLRELRGLGDDILRRLDLASTAAVTVEAGERYWLLRRKGRPLGQIEVDALTPDEVGRAIARILGGVKGRAPVIVEIPQERILAKRLVLPAAAESALDRVLRFEIGRHFPFPADRVHFRHRVSARGADGTITVEVVAVARETLADIMNKFHAAGAAPRAVALAAAGESLILSPAIVGSSRRTGHLDAVLGAALGFAVTAALLSPILRDRIVLARLDRDIVAIAPQAQKISATRAAARRENARAAAPLRLEAERPALLAILATLTKAVPDGSWLTSLSISGHELVIDGLSPSAASVALALDQSHAFSNVTFRSPITRDPQTGLERFQLSAALPERRP